MKNLFKHGGIGVIILLLICISVSCCQKKSLTSIDKNIDTVNTVATTKTDSNLVTFENKKQLNFQIVVLKQFDSLTTIIKKQGKLIDSLTKAKSNIHYVDKLVYKEKLSSKYNDKQIDSIIQSNLNLRNIIKYQNTLIKK